jgi:hypothetical protein
MAAERKEQRGNKIEDKESYKERKKERNGCKNINRRK